MSKEGLKERLFPLIGKIVIICKNFFWVHLIKTSPSLVGNGWPPATYEVIIWKERIALLVLDLQHIINVAK